MWKLVKALEGVIQSSDPVKREALAQAIDAYARSKHFQSDFLDRLPEDRITLAYWISILTTIDEACRPDKHTRRQNIFRLVDHVVPPN
jgi:hypothetical protein